MVSTRLSTAICFALVVFAPCVLAQDPYDYPKSPVAPKSESYCSQIKDVYQRDLDGITSRHQQCLDAHPRKDNPDLAPRAGTSPS